MHHRGRSGGCLRNNVPIIKLDRSKDFQYNRRIIRTNNNNKTNTTKMSNKNTTPAEVIEYLVNYFETFNSLPTPVIECQVSGTAYTAFGTNLKGKIEKAGGIRELLTTFTGRGMKKVEKKKEEVKATITPRKKTTKKVIHISANDLEESRVSLADLDEITA
jgi:hypothetical protein